MTKTWIENDRIWGSVLITIGVVAVIWRPFERIDDALRGETDFVLTILLMIMAGVMMIAAAKGTPSLKALLAIWVITP